MGTNPGYNYDATLAQVLGSVEYKVCPTILRHMIRTANGT